jgi:phosphoribosylformimino-5-aminoimidazole carboxamide ribonucleotide (ProFAR) isomerase
MTNTLFQRSCSACGNFKLQLGGGIRIVHGFRQWVCAGCKNVIDKQKDEA